MSLFNGVGGRCVVKDNTPYSLTGTTAETVIFSQIIPLGIIEVNDSFRLNFLMGLNTNNANVKTVRVYFNETPDLSGTPKLVGMRELASTINANFIRNLHVITLTALDAIAPSSSFVNDESLSNFGVTTLSVDFTVNQYLIITGQLSNSADTMGVRSITCNLNRKI